jgi:hypothetical protein
MHRNMKNDEELNLNLSNKFLKARSEWRDHFPLRYDKLIPEKIFDIQPSKKTIYGALTVKMRLFVRRYTAFIC